MSTYYTEQLKSMNYDTKQWLLSCIPRAFSLFISLRDDFRNISAEDLRMEISSGKTANRFRKQIEDLNSSLDVFINRDLDEWICEYGKYCEDINSYNKKRSEESASAEAKFSKVLSELEILKYKFSEMAIDEQIIKNCLKFATDQITETMKFDCSFTPAKISYSDIESFKEFKISECRREIARVRGMLNEQIENDKKRLSMFDNYVHFINENFQDIKD